jgi:hypothetical protein
MLLQKHSHLQHPLMCQPSTLCETQSVQKIVMLKFNPNWRHKDVDRFTWSYETSQEFVGAKIPSNSIQECKGYWLAVIYIASLQKWERNKRTMYLLGDPNARLCHGLQQVSATKQHHPHLFCTNIPPGSLWSYRASMLIANHHNCWLVWHKYLKHQHSMRKKSVKLPSAAKARELTAASTRLSTVSVRW